MPRTFLTLVVYMSLTKLASSSDSCLLYARVRTNSHSADALNYDLSAIDGRRTFGGSHHPALNQLPICVVVLDVESQRFDEALFGLLHRREA